MRSKDNHSGVSQLLSVMSGLYKIFRKSFQVEYPAIQLYLKTGQPHYENLNRLTALCLGGKQAF